MEVWPLDGKLGDGSRHGTPAGDAMFPGNNLAARVHARSRSTSRRACRRRRSSRRKSRPDGRARHRRDGPGRGQEALRALAVDPRHRARRRRGRHARDRGPGHRVDDRAAPTSRSCPTVDEPGGADVRRRPAARRSSTSPTPTPTAGGAARSREGGVFFQRYNGNGVDVNRDWPDIGFTFRPYSGALRAREPRACPAFLRDVKRRTAAKFAAGDDLHGQPFADALSYTLLPHGRHDFGKNKRIRETAKTIHRASEEALEWSPIIQPNDAAQGGGAAVRARTRSAGACAQIYGQTWGTVYDTINYTTTGALGDWFDSLGRARAPTGSTTRCRSRTSTRTSSSTRTPSSSTSTATRR